MAKAPPNTRAECAEAPLFMGDDPNKNRARHEVFSLQEHTAAKLNLEHSEQCGNGPKDISPVNTIRLIFAYAVLVFNLPQYRFCDFAICCKGCSENIPAPVRYVVRDGATCHRRYSEGVCHTS